MDGLETLDIGFGSFHQGLLDQIEFYTKTINRSGCRPVFSQHWFQALEKVLPENWPDTELNTLSASYYVLRSCPGEWAHTLPLLLTE